MRLKKLEITGFKSFREKVVLDFSPGIGGIVGPNGCGKSNIADAIRWVMGEQRVKTLRGKKMDDVIFNGSEEAAPVGMAEVSMTMVAGDQPFPGDYAEFSEMMIARRLFRDGESEYLINKIPCRLLDVREFFMGSGVGARTYSLVEQNSVSTLVEAKPEERRQFIEEAAGISKYKSRKEAAVRKMEATRENMVRLNDILREVRTQLNAISRQARRAEQYKALRQSLREAELALALQSCVDLMARQTTAEGSKSDLDQRCQETQTRLQGLEAALEALKAEVSEQEGLIATRQETLYATRNRINIQEQGIGFAHRKIADLTERRRQDLAEVELLQRREGETGEEIAALQEAARAAEAAIGELGREVASGGQSLEELRRMDRGFRQEQEEIKARFIDVVTEKVKLKNAVTSLNRMVEDYQRREARENQEITENARRSEELRRTIDKLRAGLDADEERFEGMGARREEITDELERTRGELAQMEENIAALREQNSRKAARLASLREFEEGYGWCNEGVKSLLTSGQGGVSRELFLGLVADHIGVPREYETAVEAVLGEKLQYVVVKDQSDGVRAIDYLKSAALGRGSFVPLDVRNHAGGGNPAAGHGHLQEAVPLLERITVQQEYRPIVNELLGDVLLIPNLTNGIALWRQNGFCGTFVTPEGDIISRSGILTGGSGSSGEKSLLKNRREIAELTDDVEALAEELREEQENRRRSAALIAQWDEELLRLRSETRLAELRINGLKKDMERYEGESRQLVERLKVFEFNRETLRGEAAAAREKIATQEAQIKTVEAAEAALNEGMAAARGRAESLQIDLEQKERALTERKIRLSALETKRSADLQALNRLASAREDHARQMAARLANAEACDQEARSLTEQIGGDENSLKDLYGQYEAIEAALAELREAQRERESLLREREAGIREVKQLLDRQRRECGELEVACREVALQLENLQRNIRERHALELNEQLSDFRPLDPEAIAALKARMEKDRQSLDQFGEVNLLAVSEHEELQKRFDFLTTQIADLNASLETLQTTITRINAISRKRFSETFAGINQCFQEVFVRLFPGGRAELRLTDESDLLETGVDIEIRIPGKRTQSVTLLSGGEKSLSAIALIFSILLYRPVPFLLLDEVDAALDDNNIGLFNRLVKETAAHSQILMITHNKRSMEVADSLYGVTMQKQGVSTLVSVSLS